MYRAALRLAPLILLCVLAQAQPPAGPAVSFNGSLGGKAALLVIDGAPRTVQIGASVAGVRLVALDDAQATVEVGGKRQSLVLGATPSRVGGGAGSSGGRQIVLSASHGGHFVTAGMINGRSTQFLVDTGATRVALSVSDARRLNVSLDNARRSQASTANGIVTSYLVTLDSLRIGDVELRNVEAAVIPADMPQVLLGNSFLNRFQMRRENDLLTLDLRY